MRYHDIMLEVSKPLQLLRGGTVIDRMTFGQDLHRTARATMTHVFKAYEHGYRDSDCLTFAKALVDWADGHQRWQ
jgi:acyl CoA:acetate/3-ketoacid CoA transferase